MRRCFLLLVCLLLSASLQAQNSFLLQYWLDRDYSNRQNIAFGSNGLQAEFDFADLNEGLHSLDLQVQDTGGWSSPASFTFLKLSTALQDGEVANATYKCWVDRDSTDFVSGSLSNGTILLDLADLETGLHRLNVLVEQAGSPSYVNCFSFLKINDTLSSSGAGELTYKCWFDNNFDSLQSGSVGNGVVLLETSWLETGIHTVNVIVERGGIASYINSHSFLKLDELFSQDDITSATYKYWFDGDIASAQSGNVADGAVLLETAGLESGLHTIDVIVEVNGIHSFVSSYMFYKLDDALSGGASGEALSYSYWFDNDDAHKITGQLQNGLLMLDTDTLSAGNHYLNIQVNNVTPSHLYRVPFYKAPPTFVVSSLTDTLQGYVEGLGEFDSLSVVQISAVANPCYEFVSWNDGNTDNPREFTLTKDTVFTALFEEIEFDTDLSATICQGQVYADNNFNVSEAGVYTQNLQTENGCDSIVTLTLTVNPVATTALQAAICEGTAYTENGFNVSEAGVYTQNLQTINGCDSIVTLTLTVNSVATTALQATICEGTAYTENGFNVSEAGVYTQNLQTINGCDSVVTLTLTVNPVATTALQAAICEGTAYTENGFNVSEAGVYTQNLQTINGCDSTVTLTLTVNPVATTALQAAICEGTAYTENGFNVSEAGVYTQNLQTINGCDSIVTLTLTVNPVATTALQAAICEGTAYTDNGFNVNEAGVYTQNLQTINGCDSVVTLTLTVNPVATTALQAAICQGETYTENGFNVSQAGTYTQNLQTVNGCDSIVTLTLTVNPVATTALQAAICQGETYTENGFNVSEAGVYTQNLQTINGCDSVVTLTVSVNPIYNTELTATICEGSVYTENNFNVSEAGVYTQNLTSVNGCDSIVTLTVSVNPVFDTTINATINTGETYAEFGFNESESGTYVQNLQTVNGCDSTITLNLTVNSSLSDVAELTEITFYPNPTSGKVTFSKEIEKIEVIDNIGKIVMRFFDTNEINIETLPSGAYYLRMTIEDKTIMRKVIKE